MTGPWSETGITWNNHPSFDPDASCVIGPIGLYGLNVWFTFDVTQDVQAFVNNSTTNYGWVYKLDNESTPCDDLITIGSRENTASGGIYRPYMIISYYPDGVPLPSADFSVNTSVGSTPLTVQFTDQSQDAFEWAWDFDNNGVVDSMEQNPVYEYTVAGTYTVNLTVSNSAGSDSEIKTDYITVNEAPPIDQVNATITGNTIPSSMSAGESYPVTITLQNTGTLPWNESSLFRLGMVGDDTGDAYLFDGTTARVWLPDGANVLPGESVTFNYVMTAPLVTGEYHPSYRMVWENNEWYGEQLDTTVSVTAPLVNASITGDTIPDTITAGTPTTITITVQNTGTLPWNETNLFRLGMVDDDTGDAYKLNGTGTARVWLPAGLEVLPGESCTFTSDLNARITPGTYHPAFRMVWEGHKWYGDTLTKTVNVVGPDAIITGDTIPTTMTTDQVYDVSVTVQNTGSLPWNETNLFRLGMVDDDTGDAYLFDGTTARVWLPEGANVLPGETVTFNYTMTAPAAGTYHPAYRMVWEAHEWYGATLTKDITIE